MNQKVYSKFHLILSTFLSYIISPYYIFFNLFRKKYYLDNLKIKKILVLEYHRIGDVIIILPILKSIKKKYPNSELILVCCRDSYELIKHFNIVDKAIPVVMPWTNWDFSFNKWLDVLFLIKKIKKQKIDLAFDFKGDLRNNWFLWNIKSKISMGYNATGGSFFLTNFFDFDHTKHQKYRAENLVIKAGFSPIPLKKNIKINKDGKIVLHLGTSDLRRSWSEKKWIELIDLIFKKFNVAIVKNSLSDNMIKNLKDNYGKVEIFQGNLVDFKKWLGNQILLIGVDSMAGHLAAELGIPSISIFGSQNPLLTKPLGENSIVITPQKKCGHNRTHWRLCFKCMDEINEKYVYNVILELMKKLKN